MLAQLQYLADDLALRMKRDVAIDDPRSRRLVHSAHHGQMDNARTESILRLTAPPEGGCLTRRCCRSSHSARSSSDKNAR